MHEINHLNQKNGSGGYVLKVFNGPAYAQNRYDEKLSTAYRD